ncbi:hypothetical protein [Ferrigenium kumadai]|nr:hypothetical protein [Ferrigenium kumadai]
MKNPRHERLYRLMRQHHRHSQWGLTNGLYLPHSYETPRQLSWWDDIGFILNGRRVMVWWIHPRMAYADAIEERAWEETVTTPSALPELLGHEPSQKIWKKVGKSRKKVVGYQAPPQSESRLERYDQVQATEKRLKSDGTDFEVRPSVSVRAYSWGLGMELCVPVEVRDQNEAGSLVDLARRLIKGIATLDGEFPGYSYGRQQWLDEAERRNG